MFPAEWSQYVTNGPLEKLSWVLWDTVTFTSGTTVRSVFFNAVRATKDLGNMEVASVLPSDYAFLIRRLRFYIKGQVWSMTQAATDAAETGGLNDAQLLARTGVFQLNLSSNPRFEAPLWMIGAGGGASGPMAVAGGEAANVTSSYGQIGTADPRGAYTLARPVIIDSGQSFTVVVTWPAGVVTLEQGNTDICVSLDGELSKPARA